MTAPVDGAARGPAPRRTVHRVSDYLTLVDAAAELGIERDTLYRLIRNGDVLGVKTAAGQWMVRRENVEAYRNGTEQNRRP